MTRSATSPRRRVQWQAVRGHLRLVVAVFALNVVLLLAATSPSMARVQRAGSENASIAAQKAHLEERMVITRERLGGLVRANKEFQEFFGRVGAHATTVAAGVQTVLKMIDESRLRLTRATFAHERLAESGVTLVRMRLPVVGGYREFVSALSRLTSARDFIAIDGVALEAGPPGAGNNLSIVLDLTVAVADGRDLVAEALDSGTELPAIDDSLDEAALLSLVAGRLDDLDTLAAIGELPRLPTPGGRTPSARSRQPERDVFSYRRPGEHRSPVVATARDPLATPGPTPKSPRAGAVPESLRHSYKLIGVVGRNGSWLAALTSPSGLSVLEAGMELPDGMLLAVVGIDFAILRRGDREVRLELEDGTR